MPAVSTPAAITVSALMVPGGMTHDEAIELPRTDASTVDAIARGTAS